jgi:hypothetical protein
MYMAITDGMFSGFRAALVPQRAEVEHQVPKEESAYSNGVMIYTAVYQGRMGMKLWVGLGLGVISDNLIRSAEPSPNSNFSIIFRSQGGAGIYACVRSG